MGVEAGIPVCVVIDDFDDFDDFDDEGTVTVFSGPDPEKGTYVSKSPVLYGTSTATSVGSAKGLTIEGS
ncbi:hypothetical protein ACFWUZ_28210 [Streptomyces sp. NPDC058646]|uniref:hypothetical protein n=1 Tax=Streptomyces sp. NPDC058646 TaxID=3346574 RepID=UPI0036507C0C